MEGVEPSTRGFGSRCSTAELHRYIKHINNLEERPGFEPGDLAAVCFQDRYLKPLGHRSSISIPAERPGFEPGVLAYVTLAKWCDKPDSATVP